MRYSLRTLFAVLGMLSVFSLTGPALAVEETNLNDDGLALHGFDPVAYHVAGEPVEGSDEFTSEHNGATYRFSSAANLALFISNPDKYAPAYGGYCSYGVRVGRKFDVDPEAWKIVDGVLYVQLDQGTHVVWLDDIEKNIAIANRIWPEIKDVSAQQLGQ